MSLSAITAYSFIKTAVFTAWILRRAPLAQDDRLPLFPHPDILSAVPLAQMTILSFLSLQ